MGADRAILVQTDAAVEPLTAALLGVPQVSDLMAVESAYRFRRPIYAGNAIITCLLYTSRCV